jgi:hypothetical protein
LPSALFLRPSVHPEGYKLTAMAEIRRKLVIVGDGACGKVRVSHQESRLGAWAPFVVLVLTDDVCGCADLSADRVFERDVPGGEWFLLALGPLM